jgi:hypothetical protein
MAGKNVLTLQIRKLRRNLFDGVAAGELFEDRLDGEPHAANSGLAMSDFRIDRDAVEKGVVVCHGVIIPSAGFGGDCSAGWTSL